MDLMQIGLQSQAQSLALNNATYTRIVRGDELMADVQFEAEMRGCKVWGDPELRKTVICMNRPNENYILIHAKGGQVHQVFGKRDSA